MKKILSILITLIIGGIQVFASDIEVQPTMFSKSTAQDRVWVGTFQLVWNDFIDKIVFNPVRFREGTPTLVNELNQKTFTVNDISEDCYYKYAGRVRKNTKRQIEKAIRKKFRESFFIAKTGIYTFTGGSPRQKCRSLRSLITNYVRFS